VKDWAVSDRTDANHGLETAARILLRSAALGALLLLVWALQFVAAPGLIQAQGKWIGLSEHEMSLINYCGLGLLKILVLVLFVIPYIAVRLVLAGQPPQRTG